MWITTFPCYLGSWAGNDHLGGLIRAIYPFKINQVYAKHQKRVPTSTGLDPRWRPLPLTNKRWWGLLALWLSNLRLHQTKYGNVNGKHSLTWLTTLSWIRSVVLFPPLFFFLRWSLKIYLLALSSMNLLTYRT